MCKWQCLLLFSYQKEGKNEIDLSVNGVKNIQRRERPARVLYDQAFLGGKT